MPTTPHRGNPYVPGQELLEKLDRLRHKSAQKRFLANHPNLLDTKTVIWLSEVVRGKAKTNPSEAKPLAELGVMIAGKLRHDSARAHSLRTMGNALHITGDNQAAIKYHQKACSMFTKLGDRREVARTLSASIQPLILTGDYKRAMMNAKRARRLFVELDDTWRLARLDLNTGNIFHRQDRFDEALVWYERAHRLFSQDAERDPEAMGVALHNIAMCVVSLNLFQRALCAYQEARDFAVKHGMQALVSQADYNIATLHYCRGDYRRAINLLLATRKLCGETKDRYHVALCNLDLSEIYLELNLSHEAEEMACEAAASFADLEASYEGGKALVNIAIAMSRQSQPTVALEMLARARRQFTKEENAVWPFLTDLYQAVVLTGEGRYREAQILCRGAARFFRTAEIPSKLILAELLLAQISLLTARPQAAEKLCSRALAMLNNVDLPVLACQATQLMGRIRVAEGRKEDAYRCYQGARRVLEAMRCGLHTEELKISFMHGKLEIYESLAKLCLERGPGLRDLEEAFTYVERSKSCSLQDLMCHVDESRSATDQHGTNECEAREIRAEINWYSHKFAQEQLLGSKSSPNRLRKLSNAIRLREKKLLRLAREMPPPEAESSGLSLSKPASVAEICASLPAEATLVEYFQIHDELHAFVLTRDTFEVVPVTDIKRVRPHMEHLDFQLAKFRLGPQYVQAFGESLLKTVQMHLCDLHNELIAPAKDLLKTQHLVIVPHGLLHRLPFHALFDGSQYLIDKFSVSYAPSATIHTLCHKRSANSHGTALVMGIPDATAPLIGDEAKAVASIIPEAELSLNNEATATRLEMKGPQCRLIHIATHGTFREDNPMFSGIRLGDSILSLYDLYRFKLPVELITLSGCATGMSTIADGDELLGMVRGLIYAGAKAALLTLWDVHDRSTLEFMTCFYRHFMSGASKASALQRAVQDVRQRFPHPYYWAPFSLVGNVFS